MQGSPQNVFVSPSLLLHAGDRPSKLAPPTVSQVLVALQPHQAAYPSPQAVYYYHQFVYPRLVTAHGFHLPSYPMNPFFFGVPTTYL